MQRERQNKQNKPGKEKKEGYIIMPNNFLAEWIRVIGKGPVLLYVQLLTYCHKEKDIAWPALSTLGDSLDMSKNSLISYQKTLLEYGLIEKTTGRRTAQGNYRSNLYKVTPMRSPKNGLGQVHKLDTGSPKIALDQVHNLHPNNTNPKHYQGNNNKERENAVAAIDFKKLKKKGEEKVQAVREQLRDLDIEGKFIEQLLKDYPPRKIDEKLDLLMERKNIKNPAGWLSAALKNDYRDREQERYDEEPVEQVSRQTPLSHLNSPPSMGKKPRETIVTDSHLSPEDRKTQSRERVLKMIRKTREMLKNLKTKGGTNVRAKISNY